MGLLVGCFDGGGARGLYTASIMLRIRNELLASASVRSQPSLREAFSLVVGTSAGAIVAAAIATGLLDNPDWSSARFARFARTSFHKTRRARKPFMGPLFDVTGLDKELIEAFGDTKLGDIPDTINLCVTACTVTGFPRLFCSWRRSDRNVLLRDAVAASCIIPAVFPPRLIQGVLYVDGGVALNDPTEAACLLAIDPDVDRRAPLFRTVKRDQVRILSVGTYATLRGPEAMNGFGQALHYEAKHHEANKDDPYQYGLLKFLDLDIVASLMGQRNAIPARLVQAALGGKDHYLRVEPNVHEQSLTSSSYDITPTMLSALEAAAHKTMSEQSARIMQFVRGLGPNRSLSQG